LRQDEASTTGQGRRVDVTHRFSLEVPRNEYLERHLESLGEPFGARLLSMAKFVEPRQLVDLIAPFFSNVPH
jgi:hypothetical protein